MKDKIFITDQNISLPVNEKKYLIPFLTSTIRGSKYFETPKNLRVKKEYYAEKLLQFHQFIEIFHSIGVNLKNKSFIDVGTGNGILPKTLLLANKVKSVLGTDMYSPYEHESARIPLEDGVFKKFLRYFKDSIRNEKLSYDSYCRDIKGTAEKEIFKIESVDIKKIDVTRLKKYKFKKVGAQNLNKLDKKFDVIYCKGIEHIHDWKLIFKNFNSIAKKGTYVYFKTRPFYSYLGPHRFSSTAIPWGHALLNKKEFKRYVNQFHKNRKKKMIESFYDTTTMPRYTTDELIRLFEKLGFNLVCQKTETPPYVKQIIKFKNKIKKFDYLIKKNSNSTNLDLTTSVHHLVLQKNF